MLSMNHRQPYLSKSSYDNAYTQWKWISHYEWGKTNFRKAGLYARPNPFGFLKASPWLVPEKTPTHTALITWLGITTCEGTLLGMLMLCRTVCTAAASEVPCLSTGYYALFQTQDFRRHKRGFTLKESDFGSLKHMWAQNLKEQFSDVQTWKLLLELCNLGDSHVYWLNFGQLNLAYIQGGLSLQDFSSVIEGREVLE